MSEALTPFDLWLRAADYQLESPDRQALAEKFAAIQKEAFEMGLLHGNGLRDELVEALEKILKITAGPHDQPSALFASGDAYEIARAVLAKVNARG